MSLNLTRRRQKCWHPVAKRFSWFCFGAGITAWCIRRQEINKSYTGRRDHCRRPGLSHYHTPEGQGHDRHWIVEISRLINTCPTGKSVSSQDELSLQKNWSWAADSTDPDPLERISMSASKCVSLSFHCAIFCYLNLFLDT